MPPSNNRTVEPSKQTITAFGEILWDLLPSGPVIGGAPFNFTHRVHELGHRGVMLSRVGEDEYGQRAVAKMQALGLETGFIQHDEQHPTGTVEVYWDENREPDYTIIPNVAYDHIAHHESLSALMQSDCLCFGTLAQRHEDSRNTLQTLLNRFAGQYALYDINLRKDTYSLPVIQASLSRANVLKLNEDEVKVLAQMLEWPDASLMTMGPKLVEQKGLKYCVITLGERGVLAFSDQGEQVYVPTFQTKVVDPIGAGDAFTAGLVHSLLQKHSLTQACRFGNALGALVASQEGGTQPIQRSAVEAILQKNAVGAVDERLDSFRSP